jgi:hypothetical protein
MRFTLTALFVALLATFTMAAAPHKSVIMSWPKDTPDSVVEAAKKAIIEAKGTITHEYSKQHTRNTLADAVKWIARSGRIMSRTRTMTDA